MYEKKQAHLCSGHRSERREEADEYGRLRNAAQHVGEGVCIILRPHICQALLVLCRGALIAPLQIAQQM